LPYAACTTKKKRARSVGTGLIYPQGKLLHGSGSEGIQHRLRSGYMPNRFTNHKNCSGDRCAVDDLLGCSCGYVSRGG